MRIAALCVLAFATVGMGPGLAHGANVGVVSSDPAAGAVIEAVTYIDVTFSAGVEIPRDGARLVSPDGADEPAGPPKALSTDVIRVPVPSTGDGLFVLSLTGTERATGDPVAASVPFSVGVPIPSLDTAKSASASSGAELGRALAAVALIAGLLVLVAALVRAARARRAAAQGVVPLRPMLIAAGSVALIGAVIGVAMAIRSASAWSAGGFADLIGGSAFALWSLAVGVLGVALILASGRVWRGRIGYALGLLLTVGMLVALSGVATAELPRPATGDVELRTSLDNGVQASLTLSPAAAGRNIGTVVLGGLPQPATRPVLVVRPLDGRVNSMFFPLTGATDETFASANVVLPFPGRWRAEIRNAPGITAEDPAVFDFDVQPNEGAFDGSGS